LSRAMLKTFFNGALLGAREKGEELSYVSRLWVRSSVTKAFSAEQRLLDRFLGAFKCSKVYVELERYGVQYINTYSLNKQVSQQQHDDGGERSSAVVFTHGFGGGSGMFYHILNELAALEYSNVFAIDWLGMGRSSRPTSGLMSGQGYPQRSLFSLRRQKQEVADECIDYFVESLEKWREEMKISKLQLVGHSLGGYLSARYAIAYPDRVEKLVLLSPVGVPELPEEVDDDKVPEFVKRNKLVTGIIGAFWSLNVTPQSFVRFIGPWGLDAVQSMVKRRFSVRGMSEEEMEIIADYLYHINVQRASGEYALNALLVPVMKAENPGVYARRSLAQDLVEKLPRSIPLVFLYGDRDWMFHPEVKDIVSRMPNAELQFVSNSGHHVYLDHPAEFKRIMAGSTGILERT